MTKTRDRARISALLLLSVLLAVLPAAGCVGGGPGGDTAAGVPDTSDSPADSLSDTGDDKTLSPGTSKEPAVTSSPAVTTAEVTTAEVTTDSPNALKAGSDVIGFVPFSARVTDGDSVYVRIDGDTAVINPLKAGSSVIEFRNIYGETAGADVTVSTDLKPTAVYIPFEAPKVSFNLADLGVKPAANADITTQLQSLVNKANEAGGGTVYVPSGSYRISSITMKPGVDLKFAGFVPDATVGYTTAVKRYVSSGKPAVITAGSAPRNNIFFYNTPLPQAYCTEGMSDFSISGGVFNCQAKMKLLAFACGSNIRVSDMIVKDLPNNHALQIDGCTGLTVDNVMFAGYYYPANNPVLTRETIQLEPTTPGSITSDYAGSPILATAGDYHTNSDISVLNCYFGKSDFYGPQLVAVGHHSTAGSISCDGFRFIGNVVDNPLYCGLHLPNVSNAEIRDNTFISVDKLTSGRLADDSALISLYSFNSDTKLTIDGKNVVYAFSYEHFGDRNYIIENNSFVLGGKTYLRALYFTGASADNTQNAAYVSSSAYRYETFGGELFQIKGYLIKNNCCAGITVRNNSFEYTSAAGYKDCFCYANNVNGFFFENNEIKLADGVSFSRKYGDIKGISTSGTVSSDRAEAATRRINLISTTEIPVTVNAGGTNFTLKKPDVNMTLTLTPTDGGRIVLNADRRGNLTVDIIPDEGYVFSGFTDENGNPADLANIVFKRSTRIGVVFKK